MMKRTKSIALLLALMLILGTALAEINAPELEALVSDTITESLAQHAGETGDIHAIEIAELDAPRAGAAFDTMATIVGTRQDGGEASWQTPVVWTDMAGNLIETARGGEMCMPFIAFFVPEGYNLVDVNVRQNVNLTLPAFLKEATDQNDTLYFLESPTSGLIFITGAVTVPPAQATPAPAYTSARGKARPEATPDPTPRATLRPDLMVHTNPETVREYGAPYMEWLIETVKNVIEPKAVNMLIEAFPVYREALKNGQLSSGIGFFVEKQQNTIAYVRCATLVYKDTGNLAGKSMRVVVNADFFAKWDAEKGEYVFNEERRSDLEFTLTHEILHATMYDFTTNGALGVDANGAKAPENKFPTWFTEGAATAVDNAYRYRRNELLRLCLDLDRFETENTTAVSFTPDRIIENYRRLGELYNIDGGAGGAEYAYTSGYLASIYLMQLASEHLHGDDHAAGRAAYKSEDMREGFNYILGALHGGQSLDDIVRDISAQGDGDSIYDGLADFQSRFLAESDREHSATFCASFLKYLESLGQDGRHSWGCILIDFDDMRETLFNGDDTPTEPLAYKIQDTGGYVKSDVSVSDALGTGGAVLSGQPVTPSDQVSLDAETDAGEGDLAAKGEKGDAPGVDGEPSAEPSAEPSDEPAVEPSDEPAADPSDEPAVEPSDEPAADPDQTPDPDAEPSPEPEEPLGDEETSEPEEPSEEEPFEGEPSGEDDPLAGDEPLEEESFEDDPYEEESYEDDPYEDESYDDDPYEEESYEDDPYEDDPYVDESYDDDPYDPASDEGYDQPDEDYDQPDEDYDQPDEGYDQPDEGYDQPGEGYDAPDVPAADPPAPDAPANDAPAADAPQPEAVAPAEGG